MRENWEQCFDWMIAHEGGYVDHERDPGGATNLGITRRTLADWKGRSVTKQEVKDLTLDDVKPIYKAGYWDAVKGDELPHGIDHATFDFAVNSGAGRATRELQTVLGVYSDGRIGPITLNAARKADPTDVVYRLCRNRLEFLKRLSHWDAFGRGWSRRVERVEAEALSLIPDKVQEPEEETGLWASIMQLLRRIFDR